MREAVQKLNAFPIQPRNAHIPGRKGSTLCMTDSDSAHPGYLGNHFRAMYRGYEDHESDVVRKKWAMDIELPGIKTHTTASNGIGLDADIVVWNITPNLSILRRSSPEDRQSNAPEERLDETKLTPKKFQYIMEQIYVGMTRTKSIIVYIYHRGAHKLCGSLPWIRQLYTEYKRAHQNGTQSLLLAMEGDKLPLGYYTPTDFTQAKAAANRVLSAAQGEAFHWQTATGSIQRSTREIYVADGVQSLMAENGSTRNAEEASYWDWPQGYDLPLDELTRRRGRDQ